MIPVHFYDLIQKSCLPGIWSKGVSLTRSDSVVTDSSKQNEIILRIRTADHPVSPKVTLWPEDEDWFCDCGAKTDVCAHVAAAVIALKTGKTQTDSPKLSGQIQYRFARAQNSLLFERWLSFGNPQTDSILKESLVSIVGGVSSGRIQYPAPIVATREDYAVDYVLSEKKRGELDKTTLQKLLKTLAGSVQTQLDGSTIEVSAKPFQIKAQLLKEKEGFRLKQLIEDTASELFQNGAALCGKVLRPLEVPSLTPHERLLLSDQGRYFSKSEISVLFSEIIPELQKKISIEANWDELPKTKKGKPKIVLHLNEDPQNHSLSILPTLTYENPSDSTEIILADPLAEKGLIRKLQTDLQLAVGQTVHIEGTAAVDFYFRLKGWETKGSTTANFVSSQPLVPKFEVGEKSFEMIFETSEGSRKADPALVLQGWRQNQSYVPLLGGGWAPLPMDWLNRYAERISALIEAQSANQDILPNYLLPETAALCEESHQTYPDSIRTLKNYLENISEIPTVQLPADLTVSLRTYQLQGVRWLNFLREAGMGAMLADDMGLGKTLQTLCSIHGKTLIVAPTSVLPSWVNQIKTFRPKLKYSVFHGSDRQLDLNQDVILTTYALLRLDQKLLIENHWDTVVLDETQTIKNPGSQVAQAAYRLQGDFKIALSGTPIENKLEDLWSQFQFLNPGLLGSLETFQEQYIDPISRGDKETQKVLQKRIQPFLLRRLKNEVAPELPSRTESVLYSEMTSEEWDIYNSLIASTRKEILQKLEKGQGILAALELLLRLRQACCHGALVPGQTLQMSSKLALLVETLEKSIALGHRALVFSQWTSYLDLMEPILKKHQISYSRLDGTTKNRDEVVSEFQSPEGPSVMLLSLKAGGVGLTLTAADHIFIMDPWWNPAVEEQAANRAHRIGQKNPVFIHRLVAKNTIEEKVLDLQKAKQQLAQTIFQEGAMEGSIAKEDLMELLNDL